MFFTLNKGKYLALGNKQLQEISILTPKNLFVNSQGGGVFKGQGFKGKYNAKLEFPEGYGYFLEQHNLSLQALTFFVTNPPRMQES